MNNSKHIQNCLSATLSLGAPVTNVSGVSSARAADLRRQGIVTVRDLVTHFPRRYIDMSQLVCIEKAPIGSSVTIVGEIYEVVLKHPKPRLSLVEVSIVDTSGIMIATFFRQPWLAKTLKSGTRVSVAGTMEFNFGFKRMTSPFMEELDDDALLTTGRIIPVHPSTDKIPSGQMRRLVENALQLVTPSYDPIPLSLRKSYHLMSRNEALRCIHFPSSTQELYAARRRLVYEEVLFLELFLKRRSESFFNGKWVQHQSKGSFSKGFEKILPFALTDDQRKAVKEIQNRMRDSLHMNHLLLGDVGTGKTIVAGFACACAADNFSQTLMMGPTEVLAWQYGEKLGPLFDEAGITWAVLTKSTSPSDRVDILQRLKSGHLDVLFGTHALLQDDVKCQNCSLVIIDEQQRFGVEQRKRLVQKGECPDILSMTATPIPRSLALAVYGSMSLSYMRQVPYDRPQRTTYVHDYRNKGVAFDAALEACRRGEQVYVVCPLVGMKRTQSSDDAEPEENEEISYIEDDNDYSHQNITAAKAEAAFLQAKVFSEFRVGLLHGKMSSDDKRHVMEQFRNHELDVLVCTTVIEVGVDVSSATVMIIEDADRFGLAQLHQLRGRVGRGTLPSEIHLIGVTQNPQSAQRLSAVAETDDGFELAEIDLRQRREGDILGNRQHGASSLKLVNIIRDSAIIETAHRDAEEIVAQCRKDISVQYKVLFSEADASLARVEQ